MDRTKKSAFQFILLMGVVSLFGDVTYEGGRSVTGPYLAFLGAGAAAVGLAAGLGEFLGYAFRLVTGYIADRTKAYWLLTLLGYALIFSIPLLAFTRHWQLAVLFIILERLGKAVRSPARDAILSYATKEVGRGWGFAVHEAMDQIGAIIGPLIFSLVFFLKAGYRQGFAILWIPAVLCLLTLLIARNKVPIPQKFEEPHHLSQDTGNDPRLSQNMGLYIIFAFLCVAGFANFQILSYHFKIKAIVSDVQIPFLYAVAMAVDGLAALAIGKLYDKVGFKALLVVPFLTALIPFFAFLHAYHFVLIGIVLWGIVMGIHETIMRAAVADLSGVEKRGVAYGLFNTVYGASWFIGSVCMGFLYEFKPSLISVFVVVVEVCALFVLFLILRKTPSGLVQQ